MVEGCRRHGILFCPHDNYIDFYPDARGFSYNDIVFNEDGTPQKAWYNKGRDAQSYRWSPNAFEPWLEGNLKKIEPYCAPTAYFVDVFSAMAPFDFYDRAGRFYPKTVTTARWDYAFDQIRKMLGNNAPMISEAGHDGLIGHLDGGEADHEPWLPEAKGVKGETPWRMQAGDGERIPWHDMASHGTFVLLGGGLGPRYAAGQDEMLHGYGSDDYLCTTVTGGRNPMCDGPFSRRAVMTYWLLHDVCDGLAHSEMLSDEFAGDDIHRQITRFSNGGVVQVNRGKSDWTTEEGQVLPQYGFVAKTGNAEAEVTRREGVITGYAKSPGTAVSTVSLFVDARPAKVAEGEGGVTAKVAGVEDMGGRRVRVRIDWQVSQPMAEGYRAFLHFVGKAGEKNEGILFQGSLDLEPARLAKAGTYSSMAEVTVPAGVAAGTEIAIRFGLYKAEGDGRRLPMLVAMDEGGRARGGTLWLEGKAIHWRPEPADPTMAERAKRLNGEGKVVDFGAVATNGAFRLIYGRENWELMPLPGSAGFTVKLRLDRLNATGRKVQAITGIDEGGNGSGSVVKYQQDGDGVEFEAGTGVYAYRITMGG